MVAALGNPLRFLLTPGQHNDITQVDALLENLPTKVVIGDKGYDSQPLVTWLQAHHIEAVIPSPSNHRVTRAIDQNLYADRNKIECFFNWLSRNPPTRQHRRIATRYDETANSYLGFVHLAAIVIWLL